MSAQLKLLLIDGTNILRTVYEANPAPDSSEKADGALLSALGSIKRALKENNPTHVLPAFDCGQKNWRHDLYEDYKISRSPMPSELREKIPVFYEMLRKIHLHPVEVPGFEAEDILATGFHRWRYGNGGEGKGATLILSNDKDLIGLVAEGAALKDHFKDVQKDDAYVLAKFGVTPKQFPDYQALVGDATDSIPGVSKVGGKTAAKLLNEYGDLQSILDNADKIKGQVGLKLQEERGMAILSRKLVELQRDVPLGVSWNMLFYTQPIADLKPPKPAPKHYSDGDDAFQKESTARIARSSSTRP